MIKRFLSPKIKFALQNSPVIILNGARQSGKSTLMKLLQNEGLVSNYETLDSIQTLSNLKTLPKPLFAIILKVQSSTKSKNYLRSLPVSN
jgi:predicted AAA+ superfamily ATPase